MRMISEGASGHDCREVTRRLGVLDVHKQSAAMQRKIKTPGRPSKRSDRIERSRVDKFQRTTRRTGRSCVGTPRRARLCEDEPARDRSEVRVHARGAALLLQRQGRPDLLLCSSLQVEVRHAIRPDHVSSAKLRRTDEGLSGEARRDGSRRGADASPLVRTSLAVSV